MPLKDATFDDKNKHALEALQVEYSAMASWYDSFWSDYLNKTFVRPLQLVSSVLVNKRSAIDLHDLEKEEKTTATTKITVVDVACGTGEFVKRLHHVMEQPLASRQGETSLVPVAYYGVEPCLEMLQEAQRKGMNSETTHWIQATAETLPLKDASADIVCSTNAFHFFRNKPLSLTHMHRVLRGGGDGHLVITDWCADYFLVRWYHFYEWIKWNLLGRYEHRYPGPLRAARLRQLVQEAGFQNVSVETYTVRFWTVIVWGMQTVKATT